MRIELPTLSIRQPWAWAIVNGFKDIENRDWPTRVRGPILINSRGNYTLTDAGREALASS